MFVAIQAADKYELLDRPADRFDRILVYVSRVIQQPDVRREVGFGRPPHPSSRQRGAEHLPKRLEPAHSMLSDQYERMVARPAPKACRAIEPDRERRGSHLHRRFPCGAMLALRQAAEREQRNMQPLGRNEPAFETM